jgi:DNA-binding helix-hairpin-helix protein with protein kinase domain
MRRAAIDEQTAPATRRAVTDENGAVHTLERRLGTGGQGEVWLAEGGRRVVKLLARGGDREALRRRIAVVKRMDLRDLHVARPLALLRAPEVGYVAEFLEEMVPIGKLMAPPKGAKVGAWYQEGGGLRRRLRLLAHAGEALAGLHARGMIYGDVSHHNVFVSAPVTAVEAWLIDLDNLRHDSDLESAVYTAGYGAPEVVNGKAGPTSLSDAWGFAVLAFQTLALVHPFCGDSVELGEPEREEEAFAGRLPWIDDPTDEGNRSTRGLPRTILLGDRLRKLLRETFEEGRRDRTKRPGVGAWVAELHRAADRTVRCAGCRSTFLVNAKACLWCGAARGPIATVGIHRWEPGRGIVEAMGTVERLPLADEPLELTRRHTHGESGAGARKVEATLERLPDGVRVRAHGTPLSVTRPGSTDATGLGPILERPRILPLHQGHDRNFVIHFGPVDKPHRVATVTGGDR